MRRIGGLMVAGMLGAAFLGGAASQWLLVGQSAFAQDEAKEAPTKIIEANKFRLVDGEGRIRGGMFLKADGSPQMTLLDEKGMARIALVIPPNDTPGLLLLDAQEKVRATFALASAGPGMTMSDDAGNVRIGLTVGETGVPRLELVHDQHPIYFAPLW